MWRYSDYEGVMQGPFPAKSMEEWFGAGYLADTKIAVCGTDRKVSPPNLPTPAFFIPLGALIYWVRRGHKFTAVTVADIAAGALPEELQALKDSAEKAVGPVPTAPPASAEGFNATAAEAGGEGEGAEDASSAVQGLAPVAVAVEVEVERKGEDDASLAASMAALAVSKAVEAHPDS